MSAAGLTPAQLRDRLIDAWKTMFEDPSVTVVVKEMTSRKVFITGEVKSRLVLSHHPTTVLQLISIVGCTPARPTGKNCVRVVGSDGDVVTGPVEPARGAAFSARRRGR